VKKFRPGYSDGKKYCSKCEIYLFHPGIYCPCCGVQLRTTPADKKLKQKRSLSNQVKPKYVTVCSSYWPKSQKWEWWSEAY